jgi:hypothetical protein
MSYVCHSGGAKGSDLAWETIGEEYGVKTIAYSFDGHSQHGKNRYIMTDEELSEGFEKILFANKTMKRAPQYQPKYTKLLLARNWFQVKNSEAVFAIANKFLTKDTVSGGTGWAVQMAVDCDKPVYVYLQDKAGGCWFRYMPIVGFERIYETPILTKNFAGIGTRDLNDYGLNAIAAVYENTFKNCSIV